MLNEPHYPSQWSVAVVMGVIALLIAGIFAWAFYFNFGTLHLSTTRNFTATVDGKSYSCLSECDISLPPGRYDVLVQAEGQYDQTFTVDISRWNIQDFSFAFQLVPYLRQSALADLPEEDTSGYFKTESGVQVLYQSAPTGDVRVAEFESLKNPVVQIAAQRAIVVDSARAFFVELDTGRKIRRFDDSVQVESALLSDGGKRVLFFVELEGKSFLWIWENETNQLTPLTWYESPDFIQWDLNQDHRLLVVTDQLVDSSQSSLLDQLTENTAPEVKTFGLYFFNLDSGEARLINSFGAEKPERLLRREDRYFVEYQDGSLDELVVRE